MSEFKMWSVAYPSAVFFSKAIENLYELKNYILSFPCWKHKIDKNSQKTGIILFFD